jgi:hypothetical protein
MSTPSPEYVKRALARIAEDTRVHAANAISTIHRRNNAAGRLDSGNTLIESNEEMLALMKATMRQGAELVFNAFEQVTTEGVMLLTDFSQSLMAVVSAPVIEWADAGRTGPSGQTKLQMAHELEKRLVMAAHAALDDFSHGMQGNVRLRKEPLVNNIINNTMTNSPGAVQQAGVGTFSQSAFIQQTANLVKALDAFLASEEFQKLDEAKRDAVGDVADALKQEAAKKEPDAGKLRRWGSRLSDLTKEFGLHVAATGIWHALGAIFPGSPAL